MRTLTKVARPTCELLPPDFPGDPDELLFSPDEMVGVMDGSTTVGELVGIGSIGDAEGVEWVVVGTGVTGFGGSVLGGFVIGGSVGVALGN